MTHPLLLKEDVANGVLEAAISSLGFSLSLGFHPIVPVVAFIDGMLSRHLSRMRAKIALGGGDSFASNTAALLTHTAVGTLKMGAILNPVAGFGLPLRSIAAVTLSHSLSKGTFRLAFDKAFAAQSEPRRARAVAYASLLNFGQSLLIGLMYKGSPAATALQIGFAATGAALVLGPAARRKLREWRSVEPVVLRRVELENPNRPLMLPSRPRYAWPQTASRPVAAGSPAPGAKVLSA